MDSNDTPEVAAFRTECRSWLAAHARPRGRRAATELIALLGQAVDTEATLVEARRWQARAATDGWAAIGWPHEFGGRGGVAAGTDRVPRRSWRVRPSRRRLPDRHHDGRPHGHRPRDRRATRAMAAPAPDRRRDLVPTVLRAGCRLRSRVAANHRDTRRRRLDRPRAEGVVVGRPLLAARDAARPHRPRPCPSTPASRTSCSTWPARESTSVRCAR